MNDNAASAPTLDITYKWCFQDKNCRFDSGTLKKLLTPVGAGVSESPMTSPETGRRAAHRRVGSYDSDRDGGFMSEPEIRAGAGGRGRNARGGGAVHAQYDRDIGRPSTGNSSAAAAAAYRNQMKKSKEKLYLDFQDGDGVTSPSSDVVGNQCYATTPSSSNGGESDFERDDGPDSPTSRWPESNHNVISECWKWSVSRTAHCWLTLYIFSVGTLQIE